VIERKEMEDRHRKGEGYKVNLKGGGIGRCDLEETRGTVRKRGGGIKELFFESQKRFMSSHSGSLRFFQENLTRASYQGGHQTGRLRDSRALKGENGVCRSKGRKRWKGNKGCEKTCARERMSIMSAIGGRLVSQPLKKRIGGR